MRRPRLLAFAWTYPRAGSRAVALGRRVKQVAQGMAELGWEVDVVYRDASAGSPARVEEVETWPGVLRLHGLPGPGLEDAATPAGALARRLRTAWFTYTAGDRSGRWGSLAAAYATSGAVNRPDVIIGFYTPRGPLGAARAAQDHWGSPWIADLQDEWDEGCPASLRPLLARWFRRTVSSAARVVSVSPEWARYDERALGRQIDWVRHAVPTDYPALHAAPGRASSGGSLLYAGSLNTEQQDVRALMHGITHTNRARGGAAVTLRVAGDPEVAAAFRRALPTDADAGWVQSLGWLDEEALRRAMSAADALVLCPLTVPDRVGVPSKLFEYVATGRPVLLAGPDSGGLASLLREWEHPDVIARTPDAVRRALAAMLDGNNSALFDRSRCARPPLTDRHLAELYAGWASELCGRGAAAMHAPRAATS